jgi:hypothetical protein
MPPCGYGDYCFFFFVVGIKAYINTKSYGLQTGDTELYKKKKHYKTEAGGESNKTKSSS